MYHTYIYILYYIIYHISYIIYHISYIIYHISLYLTLCLPYKLPLDLPKNTPICQPSISISWGSLEDFRYHMVPQKRAIFGDHFGGGNYSRTLSWGMKPSSIVIWSLKFEGFNSMQNGIWGEFFGDMTYDMGFYQQLAFFFTNEIYLKNDVNGIGGSVQREPGLSENWHVPELAMIYDKSIQSFVCQGYLVFRRTDIVDWNRSKSWDLANSQQKKNVVKCQTG